MYCYKEINVVLKLLRELIKCDSQLRSDETSSSSCDLVECMQRPLGTGWSVEPGVLGQELEPERWQG